MSSSSPKSSASCIVSALPATRRLRATFTSCGSLRSPFVIASMSSRLCGSMSKNTSSYGTRFISSNCFIRLMLLRSSAVLAQLVLYSTMLSLHELVVAVFRRSRMAASSARSSLAVGDTDTPSPNVIARLSAFNGGATFGDDEDVGAGALAVAGLRSITELTASSTWLSMAASKSDSSDEAADFFSSALNILDVFVSAVSSSIFTSFAASGLFALSSADFFCLFVLSFASVGAAALATATTSFVSVASRALDYEQA